MFLFLVSSYPNDFITTEVRLCTQCTSFAKKNLCDPDFLSMCYHCKNRAIFWIFDLAELTFNIHVLIDIRLCYITLLSFSSIGARVDSNQICLVRPVWKKGAKNGHATLIVRNLFFFLHLVNGDLSNLTIFKTIFVFNSKYKLFHFFGHEKNQFLCFLSQIIAYFFFLWMISFLWYFLVVFICNTLQELVLYSGHIEVSYVTTGYAFLINPW